MSYLKETKFMAAPCETESWGVVEVVEVDEGESMMRSGPWEPTYLYYTLVQVLDID